MMLTILSGNVTSYHKRAGAVLEQATADIVCMQEARISQIAAVKAAATAREHGWNIELGNIVPLRKVRSRFSHAKRHKRCSPFQSNEATYVATLSKYPLHSCGTACPEAKLLKESGRWTRYAISLNKMDPNKPTRHDWFHVVNFYGISHPANAIQVTEKRRLFFSAFEEATRLGDVPVAVCTDANYASDHKVIKDLLSTGQWFDAAALFAGPQGPDNTFSQSTKWDGVSRVGSSRPDYVFLNQAARQACVECSVRRDFAIKNHLFLQVKFDVRILRQNFLTRILPKPFPMDNIPAMDDETKDFLAQEAMKHVGFTLEAVQSDQQDTKWRKFGQVIDRYLELRCAASTQRPGSGGRLTRPDMQTRRVSTLPAYIHGSDEPDAVGTNYLRRLARTMRQLRELERKVCHSHLLHKMDCQKLWRQVTFDSKKLLHSKIFPFWHSPLPDAPTLQFIHEVLDTHRLDTERENACDRASNFRAKLRRSWATGGRAVYETLREARPAPLQSIRDERGNIQTDVNKILGALSEAWGKLWNKDSLCPWDAFADRYGVYLKSHDCILPPITGARLQECLKHMSSTRAVAACGTRSVEMKDLPLRLLDIVATFYTDIEAGQAWPHVLTMGTVSCIRKGAEDDPDMCQPHEVLSQEPLDTRPISNLSPWKTLYSSVRFQDMAPWREKWMPSTMCGARKGKEVHDVSFQIALEMELHARKGEAFGLISTDRRKFFDLLEWDICEGIMYALGAPKCVVEAEKRFLASMTNCFKIGAAFSRMSKRSNSFVQGDSFSVQIALAVMSIWTQTIAEADVEASSFLDDSNFRASEPAGSHDAPDGDSWVSRLIQGLRLSSEFDRLSGCQLNLDKTKALAISPAQRHTLQAALQQAGYDVEVRSNLVIVGGLVHTRKCETTAYFHTKIEKAADSCFLIGDLPLPVDAKLPILGATSTSQSCFGTEMAHPTCGQVAKLTKAHMYAMFGARRRFRHVAATMVFIGRGPRTDPVQNLVYHPLMTLRRMLRKRTDLQQLLAETWHLKKLQGPCKGHKGVFPLDRIQCLVDKMHWTWNEDPFMFRRQDGSAFPWLTQDDGWWKHELRNETRQMRWTRESTKRESYIGAEDGVNIQATTALLKAKGSQQDRSPDDILQAEDEFSAFTKFKVKGAARAILRQLLTDSIFTWRRRWRMKQVSAPTCPFCASDTDETIMHINWECPAWEAQRAAYVRKYGVPNVACEACCGILPEMPELQNLSQPPAVEPPEALRPLGLAECSRGVLIRDGYVVVSTDGACPNQQQEPRLRRAGCGLFYGHGHPLNCSFAPATFCQTAVRAEIRAAARWLHWAWGDQELLTDNAAVVSGFANLVKHGKHGMSSHLDLWERIEKDWERLSPQFRLKITKVEGHNTLEACHNDETLLLYKRYNDAADELAVAGARSQQVPTAIAQHYRQEAARIKCLQQTLVGVHLAREASIKSLGLAKVPKPTNPAPVQPTVGAEGNAEQTRDSDEEIYQQAFPGFAWQATPGMHSTCFWGTVPDAKARKSQGGAGSKDMRWRYPERLFEALIWYFRQLQWPQCDALRGHPEEHVTWLELALDFQASTHLELCQAGVNGAKEPAGKRAIFFASAARRMAVMCADTLAPVDPFNNNFSRSLNPLGLPNAGGFPMRPILLCRQVVNKVLYQAALENLKNNSKLNFLPQFGDMPQALWNPHISLDLHKPRVRLRAKTSVVCAPNPSQAPRQPSNVQEVREQVPWEASQPYYIPGLSKQQISREQKRLLHNRDVDARKWHRIAPFYGSEGRGDAELLCLNCQQRTEFSGWKRKWQQRKCGGCSDAGPQHDAVKQGTLNWRKRRVHQHNETADARGLHLVAEPTAHDGRIRCTRQRCLAHLSWCQAKAFFTQKCQG